jgi:sterol desaturase/sphingolipid hydroxylase (fatty acid hydroxylase superfamily)
MTTMPHPIELLTDPVSWVVFCIYGILTVLELLFPARRLPSVPGARLRGVLAFLLFFFVSSYLPLFWDAELGKIRLVDAQGLPIWIQVALGVLAYELVGYFYHRALHGSNVLFRLIHQTHHASERLDVPSAFYFHPLDMIGWTFVTSLGLVVVCGVGPEAATFAIFVVTFLGTFQHTNLRTPHWLGYLIQRPESHSRHHQRGYHRNNYADVPLIDMLFGTFENPRNFAPAQGFFPGASTKIVSLLAGRPLFEQADAPEEPPSRSAQSSLRSPRGALVTQSSRYDM